MKLSSLVSKIKADNKIPTDELLSMLSDAIEEEDSEVYMKLYKKAYGNHLSKETCEEWVHGIAVTDGSERSTGEKWSLETTTELGNRMKVDWQKMNKYEFYAVMNAWYSDYFRTAKKYELETVADFYADLVLDYFCYDVDSHDKTVFCYYFNHVA